MNVPIQLGLFSPECLDSDTREWLINQTQQVRHIGRRAVRDMVEIGGHLKEIRDRLGMAFYRWIRTEFQWGERTATNLIAVAEQLGDKLSPTADIAAVGLYLIASKGCPEEAREEILQRAAAGETIRPADAEETVRRYKDLRRPKQLEIDLDGEAGCGTVQSGLNTGDIEDRQEELSREAAELQPPDLQTRRIARTLRVGKVMRRALAGVTGREARRELRNLDRMLGRIAEWRPVPGQ